MATKRQSLLTVPVILRAMVEAFSRLDTRIQVRNPVMSMVEVAAG